MTHSETNDPGSSVLAGPNDPGSSSTRNHQTALEGHKKLPIEDKMTGEGKTSLDFQRLDTCVPEQWQGPAGWLALSGPQLKESRSYLKTGTTGFLLPKIILWVQAKWSHIKHFPSQHLQNTNSCLFKFSVWGRHQAHTAVPRKEQLRKLNIWPELVLQPSTKREDFQLPRWAKCSQFRSRVGGTNLITAPLRGLDFTRARCLDKNLSYSLKKKKKSG